MNGYYWKEKGVSKYLWNVVVYSRTRRYTVV